MNSDHLYHCRLHPEFLCTFRGWLFPQPPPLAVMPQSCLSPDFPEPPGIPVFCHCGHTIYILSSAAIWRESLSFCSVHAYHAHSVWFTAKWIVAEKLTNSYFFKSVVTGTRGWQQYDLGMHWYWNWYWVFARYCGFSPVYTNNEQTTQAGSEGGSSNAEKCFWLSVGHKGPIPFHPLPLPLSP